MSEEMEEKPKPVEGAEKVEESKSEPLERIPLSEIYFTRSKRQNKNLEEEKGDTKDSPKRSRLNEGENKENIPPPQSPPQGLPNENREEQEREEENDENKEIELDDEIQGPKGPEAHSVIIISQVTELRCFVKTVSIDMTESFVLLGEIDGEHSITLSRACFVKLIQTATSINSSVTLVKRGLALKNQIYLGDDIFVTIHSKFPRSPVDIRRFVQTDSRKISTEEGQCLSGTEWRVLFSVLLDIYESLQGLENQVHKILRLLKRDAEEKERRKCAVQEQTCQQGPQSQENQGEEDEKASENEVAPTPAMLSLQPAGQAQQQQQEQQVGEQAEQKEENEQDQTEETMDR